uniref:TIL domain-containing protein n=1 Tax=Acrobeloides nanus TaxID=290746 RepID=A0A914CTK1_9BILA
MGCTLPPFTIACLLFFSCISFNHSFILTEKVRAANHNVSHKLSDYFKDYFEWVNNTLAEEQQHRRVKRCETGFSFCFISCPNNSYWTEYSGCEQSCENIKQLQQNPDLESACTEMCIAKCQCKDGYARHNGDCIESQLCPGLVCGENEEWARCGGCEGTCYKKFPICNPECKRGKCVCRRSEFVRHDGRCIRRSSCPA